MTRSFMVNTNDQLLIVYLSSLVRAVIALHGLVDNKATNLELEVEGGAEDSKAKKVPPTQKEDEKKEKDSKS